MNAQTIQILNDIEEYEETVKEREIITKRECKLRAQFRRETREARELRLRIERELAEELEVT